MALTANTIPMNAPEFATPRDAMTVMASAQTITTSAAMTTDLDLGGATPAVAAGRKTGIWVIDITSLDFTTTDETYLFALLGAQTSSFTAGAVELLACHDFAALAANRLIPTIGGISPLIPTAGLAGTIIYIPFTNLMQRVVYRWVRGYVQTAGTTPIAIFSSWLSFGDVKF